MLKYIRNNKTLGLKHYAGINDAPLSDLLRQDSINTKNRLIALYDYSLIYFPYTGRSIGSYIILYKFGTIYHDTHVPGPVAESSEESEYNVACTAGMALAHFRMLIHDF